MGAVYTRYLFRSTRVPHQTVEEMLQVFLTAMKDIIIAIPKETSARKLQDYLSVSLFPKHLSMDAASFNAALGQRIVDSADEHIQIKPYVLDISGKKKPFGAWGELYVLNQRVNGNGKTIQSMYTPGILHDTGIVARITPDRKVEALYQAGRTVKMESPVGRSYVNLFEIEQTLKTVPGVEDAAAFIVYGEDNLFRIKAVLTVSEALEESAVKEFVAKTMGEDAVPAVIVC